MRIRNVLKEFEAHIRPVQVDSDLQGKSEWKHYDDGSYRIKVSIRHIPLPDQSRIVLYLDGEHVSQLSVQNNKAKLDLENKTGAGIPVIKSGQVLQVKSGLTVLAEGEYKAE